MSWIIGFIGASLSRDVRERLVAFCDQPIHLSLGDTHYLAAGGLAESLAAGQIPDQERLWWIVSGTGVTLDDGTCRLLERGEWRSLLKSRRPELARVGGGFVAIRTDGSKLEAFTDSLGLRTLYWMRHETGYALSTRLDVLAALRGGATVDYTAFGSHWLAFNQLGYDCLAEGIRRLPPGGYLRLEAGIEHAESTLWEPSPTSDHIDDLLRRTLAPDSDQPVSMGLSGGLDSRTLLALRPREPGFSAHTFGPESRADVRIALRLCTRAALPCRHIDQPRRNPGELMQVAGRHSVAANAVSPASAAVTLHQYHLLQEEGKLVVDGGFGEVIRRQFMNRLLRRGLSTGGGADLLPYVSFERGDLFAADVRHRMHEGAARDLQSMLETLSPGLSIEDRLDLLAVRTRLPNFFGFEQARLDLLVRSYMPYAQPRVLDAVFSIRPRERRGGRISRGIIRHHDRSLSGLPLVKGGVPYPYLLPSSMASLYVKASKRLSKGTRSESADLLEAIREPLMDRLLSNDVKTCAAYDYERLLAVAEGFYEDGRDAAQLDWWLAFDLWREAIEKGVTEL